MAYTEGGQYYPDHPGPQQPEKYQQFGGVGPLYLQWGEQPGWDYYPPRDEYLPSQKYEQQYQDQFGVKEEKPGLLGTLGPIAAGAGAAGAAYGAFKDPKGFFGGIKDAAKGIGGFFGLGGATTQPVTQAATNAATTTGATGSAIPGLLGMSGPSLGASQAAPYGLMGDAAGNAVGTLGPGAEAPGLFGAGSALPIAAGIAAGAYTGYQGIKGIGDIAKGNKLNFQEQAALALPTFGASLLYNPVKNILDKDEWKQEKNRLEGLQESGTFVPDNLIASMPTHGRKKSELINKDLPTDFVGRDPNGNWVNNKFAQSRNEADLRPEDIVNYSAFAQNDSSWFQKPMDERLKFAEQALNAGAVREHKGTIDVDFNKVNNPTPASAAAPSPAPAQATPLQAVPKPIKGRPATAVTLPNKKKLGIDRIYENRKKK